MREAFRALNRKLMWTSLGCVFVNEYLKQVGTENIAMLLILISLTRCRADEFLFFLLILFNRMLITVPETIMFM